MSSPLVTVEPLDGFWAGLRAHPLCSAEGAARITVVAVTALMMAIAQQSILLGVGAYAITYFAKKHSDTLPSCLGDSWTGARLGLGFRGVVKLVEFYVRYQCGHILWAVGSTAALKLFIALGLAEKVAQLWLATYKMPASEKKFGY